MSLGNKPSLQAEVTISHLSQNMMLAILTKPGKVEASLSYLVAMRRHCLSFAKKPPGIEIASNGGVWRELFRQRPPLATREKNKKPPRPRCATQPCVAFPGDAVAASVARSAPIPHRSCRLRNAVFRADIKRVISGHDIVTSLESLQIRWNHIRSRSLA